jgi:hypothetical protein
MSDEESPPSTTAACLVEKISPPLGAGNSGELGAMPSTSIFTRIEKIIKVENRES